MKSFLKERTTGKKIGEKKLAMIKFEIENDMDSQTLGDFFDEAIGVGIPFTIFPDGPNDWPEVGFHTNELTEKLSSFLVSWLDVNFEEFIEITNN